MRRITMIALTGVATLGLSASLHAQGCILCYTSAANGGPGAARALDMGVISLLVPVLLLFIGVCLLIVHKARVASRPAELPAMAPAVELQLSASPSRKAATRPRNASATA